MRADGNLNEPGLEMLMPRGEEGQTIRTVHDMAAEKPNSSERSEDDIDTGRDMHGPGAQSRATEERKREGVPRGRRRGRERQDRITSRSSPVLTRERRKAVSSGSDKQRGQRSDARKSTESQQTVEREGQMQTRRLTLSAVSTREENGRLTRSKARKDDGDGAVT